MPFKWKLDRPLAVIDIEATGVTPRADRIIELAVVKLVPGGGRLVKTFRVNPGRPIPPDSTAIHGITDADVADCPVFGDIARDLAALLEGCDLAGYNVLRFDLPMLVEEFARAGVPFDADSCRVVDAQRIYHKREPRDLSAALQFYCGEMHLDAHGAEADALATLRVLEGQLKKYKDLPRDVEALDAYCDPRDPSWADRTGKLKWKDGEIVLNFSKRKGESLRSLVEDDPGFIRWMLRSDFPRDTQAIVQDAANGRWPEPPGV